MARLRSAPIDPSLRSAVRRLPPLRAWRAALRAADGPPWPRAGALHDDFDVYARPDFATRRTDPAIRAFYEDTSHIDLRVAAEWRGPLSLGYRVVSRGLRRLGQIDFPTDTALVRIEGDLHRLPPQLWSADSPAVLWGRTWRGGQRVMYAAIHSTHVDAATRAVQMDFTLPFLRGALTVSLRLDGADVGGDTDALCLTSFQRDAGERVGTWLVLGPWSIPVPIRERITVWAGAMSQVPPPLRALDPACDAYAEHLFFWGSRHFLTLHYLIDHRPAATATGERSS